MDSSNNYNRITFNIPERESISTYAVTAATISGSNGVDVLPPIMGAFRAKIGDNNSFSFNIQLPTDEAFSQKSPYSCIELKGVIAKENETGNLTSEGFHYVEFFDRPFSSFFNAPYLANFESPNGGLFPTIPPSPSLLVTGLAIGGTSSNVISVTVSNISSTIDNNYLEPYRIKGTYLLM